MINRNPNIIDHPIATLITLCLAKGLPFYAYKMPHSGDIVWGVQQTGEVEEVKSVGDLSHREGFLIAPFDGAAPTYFIQGDATPQTHPLDPFLAEIASMPNVESLDSVPQGEDMSHETYLSTLHAVIDRIAQGELRKVVMARTLTQERNGYKWAPSLFLKLVEHYPLAFVSLCYIPNRVAWLGATPELLLSSRKEGFKTMSLAATQPYNPDVKPLWNEKEVDEQQIVSDDIVATFRQLDLKGVHTSPLQTVVAGNVCHLCTLFSSDRGLTSDQINQLIARLHPTPAVGGLPKAQALRVIADSESVGRSYYAGYWGPIKTNGDLDLFVNLRCVELHPHAMRFYAGGGITAHSVPTHEWSETTLKLQTLLRYIEGSSKISPQIP